MALENVAPLLKKEFIAVRLDFDRGIGAKDIEKRYIDKEQGLPWFAFIDGDGQAIVTSTAPTGNVGFPWEPAEVAHFKTMLEKLPKASRHLTDAEIAGLVKSLEDFRKKTEGGGG
jgi:hypothetical protein